MVEQPITSGRLKGKSINMHLIDRQGNETSPLFSIDDQRRHRMVADYEDNKVMFNDEPNVLHALPTTKRTHDGSTYERRVRPSPTGTTATTTDHDA